MAPPFWPSREVGGSDTSKQRTPSWLGTASVLARKRCQQPALKHVCAQAILEAWHDTWAQYCLFEPRATAHSGPRLDDAAF